MNTRPVRLLFVAAAIAVVAAACSSGESTTTTTQAASPTTTAFALTLQILDEALGVETATMTTVHAYTSDQPLQDYNNRGNSQLISLAV